MPISTSKAEKRLIAAEARAIRARRLLEVGCFKGKTTAVLSRVAHENDGYVVAIDPMRWSSRPANMPEWIDMVLHPFSYERAFWRNVSREGYPERVHLERGLSTDEGLVYSGAPHLREFDFVFIDGEHLYDAVLADFENWGRRVRAGGKVLFHDCVGRFPEVIAAVRDIVEEGSLRYCVRWPEAATIAVLEVLEPSTGNDKTATAGDRTREDSHPLD